MIRTVITAAALSFAVLGSSAFAAPAIQVQGDDYAPQEVVSTDGVDFNDQAQVDALYGKLRAAAARVCAFDSLSCRGRALSDAVRQVDRRELTSLYNGHGHEAAQMADNRNETTLNR